MKKKILFWVLLVAIMLILSIGVFSVLPDDISITIPTEGSYYKENFVMDVEINNANWSNYAITGSSEVKTSETNNSIKENPFFWKSEIDISSWEDDTYDLNVSAGDDNGENASVLSSFVVDKTAPGLSNFVRNPEIVYNNSTVVFSVDVDDIYLNTSAVFIEGDWAGSMVSYLMSSDEDNYIYTLSDEELDVDEIVKYKFYVKDLAGNENESELFNFTVREIEEPEEPENQSLTVTIDTPIAGEELELQEEYQFTSTAENADNDTLTFAWDFGDGNSSAEQNPLHQYDTVREYTIILEIDDGISTASASLTLFVNDTVAPTITVDDNGYEELDRSNYPSQEISASIFDWSGVSSVELSTGDSSEIYTDCDDRSNEWLCYWNWSTPEVGDHSFTIEVEDDLGNIQSSTFDFTVIECGNGIIEGEEECDGSDLNGKSCADFSSYTGGDLSCTDSCIFNTGDCTEEDDSDDTSDDTSDSPSSSSPGSSTESSLDTSATTTSTTSTSASETISIDEELTEEELETGLENETIELNDTESTEDNESKGGFLTGMISREFLDNIKNFNFSEWKLKYKIISGAVVLAVLVSLIFLIFIRKKGVVSFKEKSSFVKERFVGGLRYMFRKGKKEPVEEAPDDQTLFKPEKRSRKSKKSKK